MDMPKLLLVHLDGTKAASARLAFARDYAQAADARLDVAFAVATRFRPLPIPAGDGMPPVPLLQEVDGRHRRQARAVYDRIIGTSDTTRWVDLAGTDVSDRFLRSARTHDLVILGQRDPEDTSAADVDAAWAEKVILQAGVPALVLPWFGVASLDAFKTVLVAWKSTAASARALASAWPLLTRAETVHLAVAADLGDDVDVTALLAAHGVRRVHVHRGIPDADAGSALLSLAVDCGAGVLVMGCYGHSRAREWVLGGASRTVLSSAPVPVWTAH